MTGRALGGMLDSHVGAPLHRRPLRALDTLVLGAVVGLFVLVGYAIYTLKVRRGWEERPSVQDDIDESDL